MLSRGVCSAQGALKSLLRRLQQRKDARSDAQRSCPAARNAVIPQIHESDGFDFIRTTLGLAYYDDQGHCGGDVVT